MGACLVLALFRIAAIGHGDAPDHFDHDAAFSMLVLGDTGKRHRAFARGFEGQLSVGADLAAEDRAHPADALLLLGDNFYMRGLRAEELVERIRMNIVLPYCRFVDLTGPRSEEVASACPGGPAKPPVRPIFALLGNHDHLTRESPSLQRDVVPAYVANWKLSTDVVARREVANGISLILVDSTRIESEQDLPAYREALVSALRESAGPWRVLAAHAAMAVGDNGGIPVAESVRGRFGTFIRAAVAEAGVPVQLFVAGHHHSLQAVEGSEPPGPALHVIAGSGSRSRPLRTLHPRARHASASLGFARLDWAGEGQQAQLTVSLFESASWPLLRWGAAERVAVLRVTPDGDVFE
jgi:hypothetical protein